MRIQVARFMEADYTLGAESVKNIKAVIGVDKGGFSAAGEMAIGGNTNFGSERTLRASKKHPKVARFIAPELAVSAAYVCQSPSYNPYFGSYLGTGENDCYNVATGQWTGDVSTTTAEFVRCTNGSSNVARFTNKQQHGYVIGSGVDFSSSVEVGALGNSLKVTASYGADTNVHLKFDEGKKRHFCVGGNAKLLSDSSALYPTLLRKHHHGDITDCYPKGSKKCRAPKG